MQATDTSTNRWLSLARWALLALVIGLLAAGLAATLLNRLELFAGDVLFLLRGPVESHSPVVLVAIDDASFAQNKLRWPWPRDYIAKMVDNIAAGKPKAIAIDVFFYEPSDPKADAELARAIADAGNVILVNDISVQSQKVGGLQVDTQVYNRPIPEIDKAVAGLGLTNFPRDSDGTVRRVLAFQELQGTLYYSWSMQLARLYLDEKAFDVRSANEVYIGGTRIPLESLFLRVNYLGGAGSVKTYSAYQVADGTVGPEQFAGKVVILGATSESLHDSYATPFGSQPPTAGAEINAQAVDTLLSGQFITPTPGLVAVLLAVLGAVIGIVLAVRLRPLPALGGVAGLLVVYLIAAALVFMQARLILPIVGPVLGVVLTYITGTSVQLYDEQRKRAQVRGLFERYVAPAAIDQMLGKSEALTLSGQRKDLTILFSDIRGFTSLSEGLSPDDVVEILNEYLANMTNIIFEYKGTIDKFEGDAILALWNAPLDVPDHPTQTVLAAVEMIKQLEKLQAIWATKSQAPLKIGVGINTGQAFVGNIGSARRMDYTVIGDTVNLASRLQDLTKEAGVPILFSEATRDRLDPSIKTRYVISAKVKGRTQETKCYTIDGQGW
jgi:adenylate cyclase